MTKAQIRSIGTNVSTRKDEKAKPTKSGTLLRLLGSKRGVSVEELRRAVGWQSHSVRAFLSARSGRRWAWRWSASVGRMAFNVTGSTRTPVPVDEAHRNDRQAATELAGLDDLTRDKLVERWIKVHGCATPKGIKRKLLLYSAAWHVQAKHLGGLKGGARHTLRRLVKANQARAPAASALPPGSPPSGQTAVRYLRGKLAPGVRLVREWNGRPHVVEVTEAGFLHDGKTYASLTAVARRITGTHWSGPRFFGL